MQRLKGLLYLLLVLFSTSICGQEAVSTAGGEASGGGGTVSYTVGPVLYSTNNGSSYSEA